MFSDRVIYVLLAVITATYVTIGALYAANTPPWQAPDEPAHYNVIVQIAERGCCPVIAEEDWDADYLAELTRTQFPEGVDLSSVSYEDHQPPLYYLLGSVIYTLTGSNLIALRLYSVALGAGIVIAVYVIGARLVPQYRIFGLAAAAFTAFVPQHIAILASVNNDSLALLIMAIILVEEDHKGNIIPLYAARVPHVAALGGLVGLAYLTKLTIYLPATLVVATAIIARWRVEKHKVGWLLRETAWAAGLAIAFALPLWVRNAMVYGFPDIFALSRHAEVVTGQLRTTEYIAENGTLTYFSELIRVTFNSFWGQFGWMAVPLPPREYQLIIAFLIVAAAGLAILLVQYRSEIHLHWPQKVAIWVLGAAALGTFINYGVYNAEFVQFQGRYLYPLMAPFALAVASGWVGWSLLLRDQFTEFKRSIMWLPLIAMGWTPLLALWSLIRHIIPNLA